MLPQLTIRVGAVELLELRRVPDFLFFEGLNHTPPNLHLTLQGLRHLPLGLSHLQLPDLLCA